MEGQPFKASSCYSQELIDERTRENRIPQYIKVCGVLESVMKECGVLESSVIKNGVMKYCIV